MKLDLTSDAGRAQFLDLVDTADVVVESFRPGVMDKLGIGTSALRGWKPSLIICLLTAHGQTGPRRAVPTHDNNMLSLAGIADQFSRVDGRAVMPFATKQMLGDLPTAGADYLSGMLPCYGYYATKDDRQIAVGALEPKFWAAFCAVIDRPDLMAKGWVIGSDAEAATAEIAAVFREKTIAEWSEILSDADACVTPVLPLDEAMSDQHLTDRAAFWVAEDPQDGPIQHLSSPFVVDGKRSQPTSAASWRTRRRAAGRPGLAGHQANLRRPVWPIHSWQNIS